jgi:hypothetical protein
MKLLGFIPCIFLVSYGAQGEYSTNGLAPPQTLFWYRVGFRTNDCTRGCQPVHIVPLISCLVRFIPYGGSTLQWFLCYAMELAMERHATPLHIGMTREACTGMCPKCLSLGNSGSGTMISGWWWLFF